MPATADNHVPGKWPEAENGNDELERDLIKPESRVVKRLVCVFMRILAFQEA